MIQGIQWLKKWKIAMGSLFLFTAIALATIGGDPFEPEVSDFSQLAWTEAFSLLHQRLEEEYAFTEWKGIQWNTLWERSYARIERAQEKGDFESYYLALREYLHAIPDGHVSCANLIEIDEKHVGGGFGFSVAKVADGRLIITWVDAKSAAWEAGIRPRAEILEWNGESAKPAFDRVSTAFAGNSATDEDLDLKRTWYFVRAPVGAVVTMAFANEADAEPKTVCLRAYEDEGVTFKRSYPSAILSDGVRDAFIDKPNPDPLPESMVETALLEDKILYIRVWGELDADLANAGSAPSTLDLFRKAIKRAIETPTRGIIVDLRNNVGGLDEMAAQILGSFYPEPTFYEYQLGYNKNTKRFERMMADAENDTEALYIRPAPDQYTGRVIALVNSRCVSSGEGIAMGIRNLPNGDTLGFFGTNGSFGLSGSVAVMPGSLTVHWPCGQSLGEDGRVQLDSRDGVGGVAPTIRIPMTVENAIRVANGIDVELEAAVRLLMAE